MAGEWIKMRNDLAEDPAVISMAGALGVDEDLIVGKLHRLWSWADRQSRDGHAVGVTQKWIDRHIRCDGFAAAMAQVGWLAIDSSGISFPNFDRHNGETAKTRALGTKRKQKQRTVVPQVVPDVSRTDRDKSETREEKRREEKKEQKTAPLGDLLEGVSPEVARDFKALRTRLRAPITATAMKGIRREAAAAGIGLESALAMCCERGWRGFKAEWLNDQRHGGKPAGDIFAAAQ